MIAEMLDPMLEKAKTMPAEMMDIAKMAWFAGVGAMVVAEEETGKLWNGLVEKGQAFESGNSQLAKFTGSVKNIGDQAIGTLKKVNQGVEAQVGVVLHRIGVPTVDEISQLTARVETLSAGVEKLKVKAPAKAEAKPEPVKAEPAKAETAKAETAKAEPKPPAHPHK